MARVYLAPDCTCSEFRFGAQVFRTFCCCAVAGSAQHASKVNRCCTRYQVRAQIQSFPLQSSCQYMPNLRFVYACSSACLFSQAPCCKGTVYGRLYVQMVYFTACTRTVCHIYVSYFVTDSRWALVRLIRPSALPCRLCKRAG